MNNLSLISTILIVAAINTFVVTIAVYLIFKIKNKKEDSVPVHSEVKTIPETEEVFHSPKERRIKEELQTKLEKQKGTEEKKEDKIKEDIMVKPRFLKYTPEGYIEPEKDKENEELKWR